MDNIKTLKKKFKDKTLLEQALTHRSWPNEHPGKRESNERLEFLGDAIIEYVVSSYLYKKLPEKEEGFLTVLRSNIVNTKNLAGLARRMKIGQALYLSAGEEQTGGRNNSTLLANTVEAVVGAIYFDQGLRAAKAFIEKHLLSDLAAKLKSPLKDPKSLLQEKVQAVGYPPPDYQVIEESGPDHTKEFTIKVVIEGKKLGIGKGKSKHEAEQEAAHRALASFRSKN